MSIVQISRPSEITEADWNYYLCFQPYDYISSIAEGMKHSNRFFVDERFQKLIYSYAFSKQTRFRAQKSFHQFDAFELYRARLYKESDADDRMRHPKIYGEFQGYNAEESFVPNKSNFSGDGRSNPDGISYLYASNNIRTCLLEKRVKPGDIVSVATIKIIDRIFLFDASPNSASIMEESVERTLWANNFVLGLRRLFSMPYRDQGDYLLCQYISEYLKNWNFDGIMYHSSLEQNPFSSGINFTIFNYQKCKVASSRLYYISSVDLKTSPEI